MINNIIKIYESIINDEVTLEYDVSNNQARFQIEISGLVELIEIGEKSSEI